MRLDGFQLAREVRIDDATSRAWSAQTPTTSMALTAGANACLPWPLEADALRATVRELLGFV